MSKIDDVFGPIAPPLIQEWGQDATFIKVNSNTNYDPATGAISEASTSIAVKAVIEEIQYGELNGQLQEGDYSIFIDPGQVGNHFITTRDRFRFDKNGRTIEVKVIKNLAYRGDNPVFYELHAREQ